MLFAFQNGTIQCETLVCPAPDCPPKSAPAYVDGKCCKECKCKQTFADQYLLWKNTTLLCMKKHFIDLFKPDKLNHFQLWYIFLFWWSLLLASTLEGYFNFSWKTLAYSKRSSRDTQNIFSRGFLPFVLLNTNSYQVNKEVCMLTFPCTKEVCNLGYFGQQVKYGFITQDSRIHLHGVTECVLYVGWDGGLTLIKNKRTTITKTLARLCEEALLPFLTLHMKLISEV